MPNRIVMHADLDYFYAQCEELRNPELKGRPTVVCIYSGRTEDSGAVSTSNYEARKLGIRSGLPIVAAKRMASADTTFIRADLDYYDEVSERIMAILRSSSVVMEQASVDEAYLEFTGILENNDQARQKALDLKAEIMKLEHLTCSIGIGPNKLISKMAAGVIKPDGLTVINEEDVQSFLDQLPVGKLFGVGRVTEGKLNNMDVQTVRDLRLLELRQLQQEFGSSMGLWLHSASRGVDEEPVKDRKREQYGRIVTLKQDTRDRGVISEKASALISEVVAMADRDGTAYKTISFTGIMEDLSTRTKNRSLPDFMSDVEMSRRVIMHLIDEFLEEHEGKLRRIGVRISNLSEKKGQKSLSDFI